MRLCLLALALVALPASAQTLDPAARPIAGTLTARADGAPAAIDLALRSSDPHPSAECPGRLGAGAPDAVVDWAGGDLTVWTRVDADATMTVITPGGDVRCDDDGEGRLPVVQIDGAERGRYAVWLGSFGGEGDVPATLYAGTAPSPVLSANAPAQAGDLSLSQGFGERVQTVFAAGQDRVSGVIDENGNPCEGYVRADRPALRVRYAGGSDPLVFSAISDTDLVLFAETPGGPACNDDINPGDTNPLLVIDAAPAGDYVVWVGTWGSVPRTADLQATLTVSADAGEEMVDFIEDIGLDLGGSTPYSTGTFTPFDPDAEPAMRVDFERDETLRLPMTSSAVVPNPVQGGACRGFLPASPSAWVDLDTQGPLALRAESDTDLVLVARLPGGGWLCSDDADGSNPGIQIDGEQDGRLTVWVGTFGTGTADAVLTLGSGTVEAPAPPPAPGTRSDTPFTPGVYSGGLDVEAPLRTLRLRGPRVRANVLTAGTTANPLEGTACVGFLTSEPSVAVDVAIGGPMSVRAFSATDAVMVVRTPGGDWFCSDDAEGTEPEVTLDGAAGIYSVWLGTFSAAGDSAQMTLTVARTDG